MQDIFGDLKGVVIYFDDILIFGSTKEEHDERLRKVLQRAKEVGLKLNFAKCKIGKTRLKYLGNILTESGIEVDPEKVKAVTEMEVPTNKKELQQFLGMLTYLSKYIPNLSTETALLRELLLEKNAWTWTEEHIEVFNTLKTKLVSPPVLAFYNPKKPITLSVDASQNGLGAVILQENQPLAYASRALSPAERNYAQIEKEMAAIVFGAERFHHFIYGKEILAETDHKPLEIICKKPIADAPPRLQRFLLRLQRYTLKVKYVPGAHLYIPDALSRNFLHSEEPVKLNENAELYSFIAEVESQVNMVLTSIPASPKMKEKIKNATIADNTLRLLSETIKDGWPNKQNRVHEMIRNFWNIRDELTIADSMIFKGSRLLIPSELRREILDRLHEGHLGIEKTKLRARDSVFWPGINKDIESRIKSCDCCAEHARAQTREPLIPHPVPDRPWQVVATDLFEYNSKPYLLVVDYYSKFPEIAVLSNTKSVSVIQHLKSIFARHGIAEVIVSDNGPQYCSREFKNFVSDWDIEHKTSSPLYPQSNGLAERTVQTLKNMLKKSKDPYLALLEWRNTPIQELEKSPAQILMGRRLRTRIPILNSKLSPQLPDHGVLKERLEHRQQKMKYAFDTHKRNLRPLNPGEDVRMRSGSKWIPGRVQGPSVRPRSYFVESHGHTYRRNRIQLRSRYDDSTNSQQNNLTSPVPYTKEIGTESVNPPGTYATRSGRIVKKPNRYGYT